MNPKHKLKGDIIEGETSDGVRAGGLLRQGADPDAAQHLLQRGLLLLL